MLRPIARFIEGVAKAVFGQPKRPGRSDYRSPLRLETLEDRLALAVNFWLPTASGQLWNVAGNWSDGVPTVDDDVGFQSGKGSCTYNGTGGAIARSILLESGYQNTLSLTSTATMVFETLTQQDGDINLGSIASNVEVGEWFFSGGDFNADVQVAAQIKANAKIEWVSSTKNIRVGAAVELAAGGVGTIEMTNFKIVDIVNNINITNSGTFTHKAGKVSASSTGNSTNVFDNNGTYKKTTDAEGTFSYVTFQNSHANSVLIIEDGSLAFLNNSGASTAAFVQTAGTTKITEGAKLEATVTTAGNYGVEILAGNFYTIGTGTAEIEADVLFENCVVQLSRDDLTKVGKLYVTGTVEFSCGAEYRCKIKGDGTGCDSIIASDDLTITNSSTDPATLVVTVLGTLQTGKTWAILWSEDSVVSGDFENKLMSSSLTTLLSNDEKEYWLRS